MIPTIEPLQTLEDRPLWSVMIPTYEPNDYLRETLQSILAQDPGPQGMQIEVVDDCSSNAVAETLVAQIGQGRILYSRNPARRGLFGNWNACIEHARGRLVHILHQDDIVLPGFYRVMQEGLEANPSTVAGFCRHLYLDERGLWQMLSDVEAQEAGILPGWRRRFAMGLSIQCPAVVVCRDTYEQVGGFNEEVPYSADGEMWLRLAARGPVFYSPTVLAGWRMHAGSASRGCRESGADIRDAFWLVESARTYLPEERQATDVFMAKTVGRIVYLVTLLIREGQYRNAWRQIRVMLESGRWSRRTWRAALRLLGRMFWFRLCGDGPARGVRT